MNHIFSSVKHSPLLKRLVIYTLLIIIIGIALAINIYSFCILPNLKKSTLTNAASNAKAFTDLVDVYMSNLTINSYILANSTTLNTHLTNYVQDPTLSNHAFLDQYLYDQCKALNNMRGIIIKDETDQITFSSLINFCDSDWDIVNNSDVNNLSGKYYSNFYTIDYNNTVMTMCFSIKKTLKNHNYRLYFFYKTNTISDNMDTLSNVFFDEYILVSSNQSLLYSSNKYPVLQEYLDNGTTTHIGEFTNASSGEILAERVSSEDWLFYGYISNATLNRQVLPSFFLILMVFILISILIMVFIIFILSRSLTPIHELHNTMQRVSDGSLDEHVEIQTGDEIESLGMIFNSMLQNIKSYIASRVAYEQREQRMKYNLLIAQIDSHFICNTMNVINSLARRHMYKEIIIANTALTKIINNSLRVKTYDIKDTIEQELDVLQQYFVIEQLRYKNNAQLIIDVPSSIMDVELPKNILQPIVENCLLHGLMNLETGIIDGIVIVTITLENNHLHICIQDNGVGLSEEKLGILNSMEDYVDISSERGKHIGLINIYQRLHYIYGDKASMTFSNEDGFVVNIRFPVIESKEEQNE